MPRKGTDFHRLVEELEGNLFAVPGATIQSPGYLRDKVTGRKREHDIVITYMLTPHRMFVVAVECRDRRRPVDDTQVEAFARKCSKTGVDKGIIVSSSGFAPEALTDAAFCNIDCFTLEQVAHLEWIAPKFFETLERRVTPIDIKLITLDDERGDLIEPFKVIMCEDHVSIELNEDEPVPLFLRLVEFIPDEQTPGERGNLTVDLPNPGDVFVIDGLGERREIHGFRLEFEYENQTTADPIKVYQYRTGGGATLFDAATARIGPTTSIEGRIMVVRKNTA